MPELLLSKSRWQPTRLAGVINLPYASDKRPQTKAYFPEKLQRETSLIDRIKDSDWAWL